MEHFGNCSIIDTDLGNTGNPLVCSSKISILFPKYREKFFKETWEILKRIIRPFGITSRINFQTGLIEVKTTPRLLDPYNFIKGRDFFKLLARGVPVDQAAKIFKEEVFCEIINISSLTSNKIKFLKKRRRLIGNKGVTIRSIEFLTKCYLLIQGNTVSCMGTSRGIKEVRKIIINCMKNHHPILYIKNLIVKEKLHKDPTMTLKSWDEYLPYGKIINIKNTNKAKALKKTSMLRNEKPRKYIEYSKILNLPMSNKTSKNVDGSNLIKKYRVI